MRRDQSLVQQSTQNIDCPVEPPPPYIHFSPCLLLIDTLNMHLLTPRARTTHISHARCDDDHGEFYFSNGAALHFFFSHDAANKTLSDALVPHGAPDFSAYDAVFANEGNDPPIEADSVLDAAFELRDLGVINCSVYFFRCCCSAFRLLKSARPANVCVL